MFDWIEANITSDQSAAINFRPLADRPDSALHFFVVYEGMWQFVLFTNKKYQLYLLHWIKD